MLSNIKVVAELGRLFGEHNTSIEKEANKVMYIENNVA